MVSKAYRIPGASDRLRRQQIQIRNLQAQFRNRNTPRPVATTSTSGVSAAGDVGGVGNFLEPAGDTMIGPLALAPPVDFTVDIDSNNTIDVSKSSDNQQYSSNIQLEDVTTSDTLDIIKGAGFDGQILVVRTFAPNPKTIRSGTLANGGNIQTPGNDNVVVGDLQMIVFVFDDKLIIEANTGGSWRLLNTFGGSSGLSEPVILGVNELTPQTLPTKTIIDASISNIHHIIIDRDIDFDIINPPTVTKQEGLQITIDIDATGGYASPTWPSSLLNPPEIPTTPNTRFTVELYTIDEGTLWTHATSVGSSTGVDLADWANFPAVTDIDFNNKDGVKIKDLDFDDPLSTIRGLVDIQWFQAGHQFTSVSGQFNYRVDTLDKHVFHAGANPIASFDDVTGLTMEGIHVINMGNNIINTISELQLSNSNAHTPSNELSIAFDAADDALKYSVALTTDVHMFFADTDLLATFSRVGSNEGLLSIQAVTAAFLQATDTLFLSTFTNSTPTNGEIWRDISDGKFKFRENGATLELGGLPNEIIEGDSSVIVTDSGLPADAKIEFILNGGVIGGFTPISFLPTIPIDMIIGLNILNVDNLRFLQNSGTIPISITGFVADSNGLRLNLENSADLFSLTYNSATVTHQWSDTTQTSPNLILNNTLTINDSSTDPTANGVFSRNGNVLGLEIPEFAIRRTTTNGIDFTSLNIVKVDASPGNGDQISKLNYQIDESGDITTYAQTRAEIRNATNAGRWYVSVRADNSSLVDAIEIIGDDSSPLSFININSRISSDLVFGVESGSSDLMIFPQVNTLGITFNNLAYIVGSSGTNQIPHVDSLPANAAGADIAFGTAQSSAGIFDNDTDTLTLFVRQEDGNWGAVTLTRDVLI